MNPQFRGQGGDIVETGEVKKVLSLPEIVIDLKVKLEEVHEQVLPGSLAGYCVRAKHQVAGCIGLIVNPRVHKVPAPKKGEVQKYAAGHEFILGWATAQHCGNAACRLAALVQVVVHANAIDVAEARRLPYRNIAAHRLAQSLEKTLDMITFAVAIKAGDESCVGAYHEQDCKYGAVYELQLGNRTVLHCVNGYCANMALLKLVIGKYDDDCRHQAEVAATQKAEVAEKRECAA